MLQAHGGSDPLKNFSVSARLSRGQSHGGFFLTQGHGVFSGLSNQGAKLLCIGVCKEGHPLRKRILIVDQAVPPHLRFVQGFGLCGRPTVLNQKALFDALNVLFGEFAHEFANVLHLTAFALKVGDFFRLRQGVHESA